MEKEMNQWTWSSQTTILWRSLKSQTKEGKSLLGKESARLDTFTSVLFRAQETNDSLCSRRRDYARVVKKQ